MSTAHIWLVTGSVSGLGRSLAEQVLAEGETGMAMARSQSSLMIWWLSILTKFWYCRWMSHSQSRYWQP